MESPIFFELSNKATQEEGQEERTQNREEGEKESRSPKPPFLSFFELFFFLLPGLGVIAYSMALLASGAFFPAMCQRLRMISMR